MCCKTKIDGVVVNIAWHVSDLDGTLLTNMESPMHSPSSPRHSLESIERRSTLAAATRQQHLADLEQRQKQQTHERSSRCAESRHQLVAELESRAEDAEQALRHCQAELEAAQARMQDLEADLVDSEPFSARSMQPSLSLEQSSVEPNSNSLSPAQRERSHGVDIRILMLTCCFRVSYSR